MSLLSFLLLLKAAQIQVGKYGKKTESPDIAEVSSKGVP